MADVEAQEKEEQEGEEETEEFTVPRYWDGFYSDFDELELYDWYSSAEWCVRLVAASATPCLHVLPLAGAG